MIDEEAEVLVIPLVGALVSEMQNRDDCQLCFEHASFARHQASRGPFAQPFAGHSSTWKLTHLGLRCSSGPPTGWMELVDLGKRYRDGRCERNAAAIPLLPRW